MSDDTAALIELWEEHNEINEIAGDPSLPIPPGGLGGWTEIDIVNYFDSGGVTMPGGGAAGLPEIVFTENVYLKRTSSGGERTASEDAIARLKQKQQEQEDTTATAEPSELQESTDHALCRAAAEGNSQLLRWLHLSGGNVNRGCEDDIEVHLSDSSVTPKGVMGVVSLCRGTSPLMAASTCGSLETV